MRILVKANRLSAVKGTWLNQKPLIRRVRYLGDTLPMLLCHFALLLLFALRIWPWSCFGDYLSGRQTVVTAQSFPIPQCGNRATPVRKRHSYVCGSRHV